MPPEHRCPFPETGCTSKICDRRVCQTCGGDGVTGHNATSHPAWETTVPCSDCSGGAA